MRIVRTLAVAAVCIAAMPAAAAHAARDAELSMMDDQALLGASQAQVDQTLARMQSLGADRVRVSAFWADIAPAPTSTAKPAGFNAADPYDLNYHWDELDRVVSSAGAHGLHVLISISPPIPWWASTRPSLKNDVWSPSPKE